MEKNNYSKEQACFELKELISVWISEGPNRNIATLARESGVSENCIRRVMNNNSIPLTENLYKIIVYLKGNHKKAEIMSSLPNELRNLFSSGLSFLNFVEMDEYILNSDLEHLLIDFPHQVIFERSSMGSGLRKDEAYEMFGSYADTVINNLSSNKLITITNEMIVCNKNYNKHTLSTSYYKNLSSQVIQNFYKSESKYNYLFFQNESVDVKGYVKVMDVIEESSQKVMNIIKENPGEIPIAFVNCMDTFSKKDFFTKKMDGE